MGMRITVTPKRQLIHYNLNEQYIAVSVFSAYGSMEYNIYNKKGNLLNSWVSQEALFNFFKVVFSKSVVSTFFAISYACFYSSYKRNGIQNDYSKLCDT